MKKEIKDFIVNSNLRLTPTYSLLKLAPYDGSKICDTIAGQFVEVEISDSKSTFLRRPISINYVDRENNELWLLVRAAGEGTRKLTAIREGQSVNIILPLGNGFTIPDNIDKYVKITV